MEMVFRSLNPMTCGGHPRDPSGILVRSIQLLEEEYVVNPEDLVRHRNDCKNVLGRALFIHQTHTRLYTSGRAHHQISLSIIIIDICDDRAT